MWVSDPCILTSVWCATTLVFLTEKERNMTQEIRDLANAMGIVVASVWDGYSRKWIVSERDGYYPLFTTTDYDTLVQKLRSGRIYPGQ